ncbi:uncharacterized protein [Neodiprion pinetum]|uniref:uncharacterized protein n=1 Tax=Neodiprion pinetum TaxID=441929 RepID=UPI001EDFE25C|nr:uncharacterized protein LOC124214462 [Neodiprion pinetum]
MVVRSTSFPGIVFLLALIVAQSVGELIVRLHPPEDDGLTRNLTCVSESDDAALIWNSQRGSFTDFQHRKAVPENIPGCALWDSKACVARWKDRNGWDEVDSMIHPMGPIFDYRWEGLKEFYFGNISNELQYRYVGRANKSSGTVILSARGSQEVNVLLCPSNRSTESPCVRIKIDSSRISVATCTNRASGCSELTPKDAWRNIIDYDAASHANSLDPYEWRTFAVRWIKERSLVEVFNNSHVILKGTLRHRQQISNVWVEGLDARIRFHSYKYLLTRKSGSVILTSEFIRHNGTLCVEMHVGLCSECKLNVNLVDTAGRETLLKYISGDEKSLNNELITWRPFKVQVNRQSVGRRLVRLKISTALKNDDGYGQWAIDDFRTCQPRGTRESTITIRREKLDSWPRIKCQKLSYTEIEVIDLSSSMECRGTIECSAVHHGDDCHRKCRTCKCRSRDKRSGNALKEVQELIHTYLSATAVTLKWKPPKNVDATIVKYAVSLKVNALVGCSESGRETPEQQPMKRTVIQPKAFFDGLHPHASYVATVFAYNGSAKGPPKQYNFQTNETPIPTSVIHNLRIEEGGRFLRWDWPEDCTTITGNIFWTRIKFESVGDDMRRLTHHYETTNRNLDLSAIDLIPGVKHNVRAYVTRSRHGMENNTNYVNLTWTTPRGVTELEAYDADCDKSTISLRFIPSVLLHGRIESYKVFIAAGNELPKNMTFGNTKEQICDLWDDHTCLKDVSLPSNAKVNITIHATGKELDRFDIRSNITFSLEESCNSNLSWRVNFTVTQDRGNVSLKWKQPLSSRVKMTRFAVRVNPLDRRELDKFTHQIPIVEEIPVEPNRKEYTTEFYLSKSGSYNISLVAFNQRNISSMENAVQLFIWNENSSDFQAAVPERRPWKQYLLYVIILPIIAILPVLLFLCYREHKKASEEPYYEQIDELTLRKQNNNTTVASSSLENPITAFQASTQGQKPSIELIESYAEPFNPLSCKVKVEEFEEYVKEALASGLLDAQYRRFPNGSSLPRVCGTLPANESKNRYRNMIPYDDNRVVLTKIRNDPHSDYINASYIQGYRKTKAYIATQGPNSNTVIDFWRMVWQEDVRVICMLTNVVEAGKVKCEQYWPDVGTKVIYGNIFVSNTGHEVFADYTIRTLRVECRNITRKITHLHYTGWPDHGVPMYTQSLVAYLKKILATPAGKGPVVVHCSAGVGRTGTIILCDICLRQAVVERVIDVPIIIMKLRDGRQDMVDSSQQYLLAHLTMVESMVSAQTQVPCSDGFSERIQELSKQLPSDIQRLNDTVWQDRVLHVLAAPQRPTRVQVLENGSMELESVTENAEVSSTFDSESNYISVVSIDGVKLKKQYLASHLPSNSTVSEIWRLIVEKNIELIVVLQSGRPNDPTCCDIVPNKSTFTPVPNIQLKTNSFVTNEHFTTRILSLKDTSEEQIKHQPVTVLACTGWGWGKSGKPPCVSALVSLWRESEKIRRKEGPTLVLCRDGITACGLYLALSFLLERMAVERECDVISAVRAVRRSRPEFVQSVEQFVYLYAAATKYYDEFREYANFS